MSNKTVVSKVLNDYNHNNKIKTLKKDIAIIDKESPRDICDNNLFIDILEKISKIEYPIHNCEITYELKEVEMNQLLKENTENKEKNKKRMQWFYSFEGFLKKYIKELTVYVQDDKIKKILQKLSECDSLEENKDLLDKLGEILKSKNSR